MCSSDLRIGRNYQTADDFQNLVLTQGRDGHLVRLGEVARVQVGPRENQRWFRTNGKTTTGFGIIKQSTANVVEVLDAVKAEVVRVNQDLPKGMNLITSGDDSLYIRAAIKEIYYTIAITTALVGFVIFVFLGSIRATLIPLVTIPVCLIATFSVLAVFGYSINLITLLALALSIGLVVDDAIVVLENIVRHMEQGKKPYQAAIDGASEIGFTILSMTVSLAAVFIPIIFMSGIVGRLLHEFAVTIVIAVLVSGVVSVTLTPMLCARFLRDQHGQTQNAFNRASERAFLWLQGTYDRTLRWSLAHKPAVMVMFVASIVATVGMFMIMPQDFLPADDTGVVQVSVQGANGTSFERMVAYGKQVADIVNADPSTKGAMFEVRSSGEIGRAHV